MDVCLGRRGGLSRPRSQHISLTDRYIVLRDVRERGRDVEGIIKQWFEFVKPSYTRFVEPQRYISGVSYQVTTLEWKFLILVLRHHYSPWH
jgi:uridine kinase